MKEHPIIFSTESVKAILEGGKTQTRRVLTPHSSIVGEGKVDWSKFCWDGGQIYLDTCKHGHTEKHQAPLPFVDGRANEYYPYEHQYVHIPYNWTEDMTIFRIYPRWEVGDRLWVRETHIFEVSEDASPNAHYNEEQELYLIPHYKSDGEDISEWTDFDTGDMGGKWRPSIFMPRWASRITLEITDLRVERLQEITPEDCVEEGIISGVNVDGSTMEEEIIYEMDMIDRYKRLWDSLNAKRGYGWEVNPFVWVIEFATGVRLK